MPSRMDALQTPTPVNLRRLAGSFHSVAKPASFDVAFQVDFGSVGSHFEGLLGAFGDVWGLRNEVFFDFFEFRSENRESLKILLLSR